jgi:hypothetical protein
MNGMLASASQQVFKQPGAISELCHQKERAHPARLLVEAAKTPDPPRSATSPSSDAPNLPRNAAPDFLMAHEALRTFPLHNGRAACGGS